MRYSYEFKKKVDYCKPRKIDNSGKNKMDAPVKYRETSMRCA